MAEQKANGTEGEMIEVDKKLVVCEKHYESHYGEFTDCPYCRAEKAEAEIAELRGVALALREWVDAVPDLMKLNEELVEILGDESWFGGGK